MKKLLIIGLALIAGLMFAYPMQVSACHINSCNITAECVEIGGQYHIKFTISASTDNGGTLTVPYEIFYDSATISGTFEVAGTGSVTESAPIECDTTYLISGSVGGFNCCVETPVTCECPPPGDEGCTPGYWKNHPGAWVGVYPDSDFDSIFTSGPDISFLEALKARGPGSELLRHAAAAYLNAVSSVEYPLSVGQVQAAFAGGNAGILVNSNELGCPL